MSFGSLLISRGIFIMIVLWNGQYKCNQIVGKWRYRLMTKREGTLGKKENGKKSVARKNYWTTLWCGMEGSLCAVESRARLRVANSDIAEKRMDTRRHTFVFEAAGR